MFLGVGLLGDHNTVRKRSQLWEKAVGQSTEDSADGPSELLAIQVEAFWIFQLISQEAGKAGNHPETHRIFYKFTVASSWG